MFRILKYSRKNKIREILKIVGRTFINSAVKTYAK